MKLTIKIYIDQKWFLKRGELKKLNEKFPCDSSDPTHFSRSFEEPHNSPEYKALLEHLRQLGMKPMSQAWVNRHREDPGELKGFFQLSRFPSFSEKDCASCELVRFLGSPLIWEGEEGANEEMSLNTEHLSDAGGYDEPVFENFIAGNLRSFRFSTHSTWVISDEGRELLKNSGLSGWRVKNQLHVTGERADDVPCKYWQIEPTRELHYSPQMRWWLVDDQYQGSWEEGISMPDDGVHVFDRAAWEELGKPDLMARRFSVRRDWKYDYFVSQRFMKFWVTHGLKADWQPARLV